MGGTFSWGLVAYGVVVVGLLLGLFFAWAGVLVVGFLAWVGVWGVGLCLGLFFLLVLGFFLLGFFLAWVFVFMVVAGDGQWWSGGSRRFATG